MSIREMNVDGREVEKNVDKRDEEKNNG